MRQITVKASAVDRAIQRAKATCPSDWQAELLEIILIPNVYKRWKQVNDRFPDPTITRHPGQPYRRGETDPRQIDDWTIYAGYEFDYGRPGYCWNRARADHYGHSPGTAWDGVRRETYHSFVETLRMCYHAALRGEGVNWRLQSNLDAYRVKFVNDLKQLALL
jgi:hypothetical protein